MYSIVLRTRNRRRLPPSLLLSCITGEEEMRGCNGARKSETVMGRGGPRERTTRRRLMLMAAGYRVWVQGLMATSDANNRRPTHTHTSTHPSIVEHQKQQATEISREREERRRVRTRVKCGREEREREEREREREREQGHSPGLGGHQGRRAATGTCPRLCYVTTLLLRDHASVT